MATREALLRDLILSSRGQLTIPSNTADRETRKAIRELTEGDNPRADYAAGMLDLTAHPDDERLSADQQHNVLAAARNVLLHVTTPTREVDIAAHFAPSGFTPEMVRDGVNFLRRDRLATRRDGVVTVTVPAPAKRPSLPTDLLAPRNSAAPAPSSSTTANTRPNFDSDPRMVGTATDDPMAMSRRMRREAQAMPNPSFEVGDIPEASLSTPNPPKKTPVAITDSAITALLTAVLDAFACVGKPTVTWAELGVKRVELGDLPEGWTPERVLQTVIEKMCESGELRDVGDGSERTFTYIPAERAVSATVDFLTRFIARLSFDTYTRTDLHRDASGIAAPDGWSPATITDLALTKLVDAGTLTVDGDVFTRVVKPEPKPKSEPVEEPKTEVVENPTAPASAETPAAEPAKSGVPANTKDAAKPAASTAVATREDATVAPTRTPRTDQMVIGADLTTWVAAIANYTQVMAQAMVAPQASAREALNGGALLHVVLRRVMVIIQRENRPMKCGELTPLAYNADQPAKRKMVPVALDYGVKRGVLTRTGNVYGGSYAIADPTRVDISRQEIVDAAWESAMKIKAMKDRREAKKRALKR